MSRTQVVRAAWVVLLAGGVAARAGPVVDGLVHGRTQIPAVVGRDSEGAILLPAATLFVCPPGDAVGLSRHCPKGEFSFVAPPGDYQVLLEPAEPYRRGQVLTGLRIGVGELRWNAELAPDYNCTFNTMTDWHQDPWAWGKVLEQTFIARGTSITSVALKLAGLKKESGDVALSVSIRKGLGGEPIGPERKVKAKPIEDLHVSWASGEVPTVPGETYALRIADASASKPIGLFVRREHGFGYPYGELVIDGKPNGSDGYFYIGSNADDAVLTYAATGEKPAGPPATQWAQGFTAAGTSLAAVSLPLVAERRLTELAISIHKKNAKGQRVGVVKRMPPARIKNNRFLVGVACPRGEIPLQIGQEYAVVISSAAGETFHPFAGGSTDNPEANRGLAMRIYEYAPDKLEYRLPPPPEPATWQFDETIPLANSGFEQGDASEWESAWGGSPFTDVVGADWKADKFSGDAVRPHEGKFCGVIVAKNDKTKKLIRRWFSWPHSADAGLVHARIWVASPDGADERDHPLTVRLCVSDHGSADAGGVDWSRAVISPGKWTMLQCRPVVPKGRKQSVFILVEGGGEGEENCVKIDDLHIIVDEK